LSAGKQFNVRLATAAALVIGLFFGRFLPLLPSVTLSILAASRCFCDRHILRGRASSTRSSLAYWSAHSHRCGATRFWLYALAGAFAGNGYLAKRALRCSPPVHLASACRWWQRRRAVEGGARRGMEQPSRLL
jgi:hypothetical protein